MNKEIITGEKYVYNIDDEEYNILVFPEDNNFTGFYMQKKDYGFISFCIGIDMKDKNYTIEEFIDENINEWIESYEEDLEILETERM